MKSLRIFLFLSTALVLRAAPFYAPAGWTFGTEFPSTPRISPRTEVGEVVQTIAVCKNAFGSFIIIRAEYPAEIPKGDITARYDAGRDAMQKSISADLVREEKVLIGGHEGRRYVFEAKDKKRRGENRVLFVGNELYQFMFATTKESMDLPAVAAFFGMIRASEKKD